MQRMTTHRKWFLQWMESEGRSTVTAPQLLNNADESPFSWSDEPAAAGRAARDFLDGLTRCDLLLRVPQDEVNRWNPQKYTMTERAKLLMQCPSERMQWAVNASLSDLRDFFR